MPTYRLDLAYDGTGFHGLARQPGQRTVQGVLDEALEKIVKGATDGLAGRTDAGVHARHQVVTFSTEAPVDCRKLARSLTNLVGPEVVVYRCEPVEGSFSARFSATHRVYRYRILNRPFPDPLRRALAWHVRDPLDISAMNEAVGGLVGVFDFATFCRKAEGRPTVRTVDSAAWCERPDDVVRLQIKGQAFCHQMVRSIVGYCVDVGLGKLEPSSMNRALEARDRSLVSYVAPAHGLVLWEICY
jgi:tRNA pseudouridine38-40 synthase